MVNVHGNTHADIVFKRQLCKAAVQSKTLLWRNPSGSRAAKFSLMFRVATGSISWSVGPWSVTQRDLQGLNGMLLAEYKSCIRLPRLWGETDNHYHRRLSSMSRKIRIENRILDFDAYILGRMYDYVGHVVRMGMRDGDFLPCVALRHRDKACCREQQELIGTQEHQGRVAPWMHEQQFVPFFDAVGLDWKDAAASKQHWLKHRAAWVKARYGKRRPRIDPPFS